MGVVDNQTPACCSVLGVCCNGWVYEYSHVKGPHDDLSADPVGVVGTGRHSVDELQGTRSSEGSKRRVGVNHL